MFMVPPAWPGPCLAWRLAYARGRYLNNTVAGTIKYGHIGSWDVSAVKSTARPVRAVKYPMPAGHMVLFFLFFLPMFIRLAFIAFIVNACI